MTDAPHFRIGTRGSDLALWQAHHVHDLITASGGTADITILSTQGDREQVQAFEKLEGKGFFTKEIEQALIEDRIDLAVHSHKDLETRQPDGLCIAAVPARTAVKYGDRAERYVHIEVGNVAQNVYLQAEAVDLGTLFIGAFRDAEVSEAMGLPDDHVPLGIMPVGRRTSDRP